MTFESQTLINQKNQKNSALNYELDTEIQYSLPPIDNLFQIVSNCKVELSEFSLLHCAIVKSYICLYTSNHMIVIFRPEIISNFQSSPKNQKSPRAQSKLTKSKENENEKKNKKSLNRSSSRAKSEKKKKTSSNIGKEIKKRERKNQSQSMKKSRSKNNSRLKEKSNSNLKKKKEVAKDNKSKMKDKSKMKEKYVNDLKEKKIEQEKKINEKEKLLQERKLKKENEKQMLLEQKRKEKEQKAKQVQLIEQEKQMNSDKKRLADEQRERERQEKRDKVKQALEEMRRRKEEKMRERQNERKSRHEIDDEFGDEMFEEFSDDYMLNRKELHERFWSSKKLGQKMFYRQDSRRTRFLLSKVIHKDCQFHRCRFCDLRDRDLIDFNNEETYDFLREDKSKILRLSKKIDEISPEDKESSHRQLMNQEEGLNNFKYKPVLDGKYKEELNNLSQNEFIKRLSFNDECQRKLPSNFNSTNKRQFISVKKFSNID